MTEREEKRVYNTFDSLDESIWMKVRLFVLSSAGMSSPLAWQGDGPPRMLVPPLSAQYDQFDMSHSLASLTFIAAQLSTLLNTVVSASSYAAPPPALDSATASLRY